MHAVIALQKNGFSWANGLTQLSPFDMRHWQIAVSFWLRPYIVLGVASDVP
jgi:hypothetical protein